MKGSFDTNIAIYAFADLRDARKTKVARSLIGPLADANTCLLSTQVLKEFANVCLKRFQPRLSEPDILEYLTDLARFNIVQVDEAITRAAVKRHFSHRINFYDALIVEASIADRAEVLYSEDLQQGMSFGPLRVINPFL